MPEDNKVAPQDQETVEVAAETTPETSEELTPEQLADLKKRADVSSQNYERAKKAEAELKAAREALKQAPSQDEETLKLSIKDQVFLAKQDIHEDDLDEVLDRARLKKISVQDAYKQVKPLLEARAEERKTASVANVRNNRPSPAKVSDDVLLSNASQGKLPESDEDIARLVAAAANPKRAR